MDIPLEIERKFLIQQLPASLELGRGDAIRQGYIVAEPGVEVRIRARAGQYWQTVKRGKGLQREEVDLLISETQFTQLYPLTEGQRIEKTRYTLAHASSTLEIDVYDGPLEGLITAEVESPSLIESEQFSPPDWFGLELTEDERYKNKNLALHGLPSP